MPNLDARNSQRESAKAGPWFAVPAVGDQIETLVRPVDADWILEKPGRRFGYGGLPEGAGDYQLVHVLDVKPEDGTLMVAPAGGFSILRYFAECRWPAAAVVDAEFVEPWTTTAKTREHGTGALMFRGAVALEVGNGAGNMRRAAELAAALNSHGVVLDGRAPAAERSEDKASEMGCL